MSKQWASSFAAKSLVMERLSIESVDAVKVSSRQRCWSLEAG